MAEKVKAPQLFIMVSDQRPSGFIQQGTENTPHQVELTTAKTFWIPSEGFTFEMRDGIRYNKPIRYIKYCDIIDPKLQDERGFKPHKNNDKIKIENGAAIITREGSEVGLYDYLSKVYYNKSVTPRPDDADGLFEIVQLDKKAEGFNEKDVLQAEAILMVNSLQTKAKEGKYIYNEDRIDAISSLLNIFAETYQTKIFALMQYAKARPLEYMQIVSKFEQTIATEVSHALQLKVIVFEGNTAQYVESKKILKALGDGKMTPEVKAEKLSDYLKTQEGNADLTELRALLELAKDNVLK